MDCLLLSCMLELVQECLGYTYLTFANAYQCPKCPQPYILGYTVEPLYNGHFGTSHFWVIFAAYRGFPLSEVKIYQHGTVGTAKLVLNGGFLYCVLNSKSPLREVPLYHNTSQIPADPGISPLVQGQPRLSQLELPSVLQVPSPKCFILQSICSAIPQSDCSVVCLVYSINL